MFMFFFVDFFVDLYVHLRLIDDCYYIIYMSFAMHVSLYSINDAKEYIHIH